MSDLAIFKGSHEPHNGLMQLPLPPPWRHSSSQEQPTLPEKPLFNLEFETKRGKPIQLDDEARRAVNAALCLRRPLLVTGKPGVGKSSLAYAVAYELRMGPVLRWPVTSRSTAKNGLYQYDAIGRLYAQQTGESKVKLADFISVGPLGTALYPATWPRVLLIDEIDKGDLDVPNDLLDVLEEGAFEITELAREAEQGEDAGQKKQTGNTRKEDEIVKVKLHDIADPQPVPHGRVICRQFPFIVMTSNGEREFPAPFLRRCIRFVMSEPKEDELANIIRAHLGDLQDQVIDGAQVEKEIKRLIETFLKARNNQVLATDQLLNAAFMILKRAESSALRPDDSEREKVNELILKQLTTVLK